jgi:uncharacterized membrane protein
MAAAVIIKYQYFTSTNHLAPRTRVRALYMIMKNTKVKENIQQLLLRLELWFAPLLLIIPLTVAMFFLIDWYVRGFSTGLSSFDGELFIGLLIFLGNIFVDIPFLRSIRMLRKKQ